MGECSKCGCRDGTVEGLEKRYYEMQQTLRSVDENFLRKDAELSELRGRRDTVNQELIFLEELLYK